MNFLNLLEISNMDLILHIGHYKTGTTSIQFFLHKHREILLEKYKLLYPLIGIPGNKEIFGQVLLAPHYSKSSGCDFDEVVNLLINDIASLEPIKVFISSEELCAHNATVHLLERINYLFKK
jgi:hypothetical protein